MSTTNNCPTCKAELTWQGSGYHCQPCDADYLKKAYCPSCEAELEKLQACGSVSYFCNTCNELKSKSAVKIEYIKQ